MKAIARLSVFPFLIYNSKLNPEENVFTPPTFSDGEEELDRKISLILSKDVMRNSDQSTGIVFIINDMGQIKDAAAVYQGTDQKKFLEASKKLKNISGDWAPATLNSVTMDWFVLLFLDSSKKRLRYAPQPMFPRNYKKVERLPRGF